MSKQTKYVVQKSMHLGNIKTGVRVGTVIIHDEENSKIIIDGKVFDSTKDLEILIRHKWATPIEDAKSLHKAQEARKAEETKTKEEKENNEVMKKSTELPVIRSDADEMKDIDISYTVKPKPLPVDKNKNHEMPVVRGDESPEERVARIQKEVPVLEVVHDDSLGEVGVGTATVTGVKHLTAEQHAKLRQEALEKAKKGFTDPRIAQAQKAIDAIEKKDVDISYTVEPQPEKKAKRGPGRPAGSKNKGTVESIVAGTSPELPKV